MAYPFRLEWYRAIGYLGPDFSVQLNGIVYKGPVGRAEKSALFLDYFTLKDESDTLSQNVYNRPPAYTT
jgi:hypothetical protein